MLSLPPTYRREHHLLSSAALTGRPHSASYCFIGKVTTDNIAFRVVCSGFYPNSDFDLVSQQYLIGILLHKIAECATPESKPQVDSGRGRCYSLVKESDPADSSFMHVVVEGCYQECDQEI